MEQNKEGTKKGSRNFMSRNVTEFRHLMKRSYITENDLNWVINLRDNNVPKDIQLKGSSPPEVFFKQTKSSETKLRKKGELAKRKLLPNQYDRMFLRGEDHVHQTQNQLQFYNSLRKENWIQATAHSQSQKQFSNIPFKDRRGSVKFIKKDCLRKIKDISEDDFESGLDGAHKQQKYTQKILRVRNYACLSAFTKLRGRSQVSLPCLAWQVGLRDYR